jgi:hypothetical protein
VTTHSEALATMVTSATAAPAVVLRRDEDGSTSVVAG